MYKGGIHKLSILLSDMEMPKSCNNCRFSDWHGDSFWCIALGGSPIKHSLLTEDNYKFENCPLIEIPTPHGRLIDADKIEYHFEVNENTAMEGCEFVTKGEISRVPTVIEAEE